MNLAFASNVVDTIIDHHTQRRILVNTDIIENKDSIRQESDAITDILTTTPVDAKRHASAQEKFDILKAVVGERVIARLTELKNTGSFSVKTDSNPYTAILTKLSLDSKSLHNHYRVLELTYSLGDLLATATKYDATIENIISDLSSLTGMNSQFFGALIDIIFHEHHLAIHDQSTSNIFELIPAFEQQNKMWLIPVVLNSISEIKNHPLSDFASAYLNPPQAGWTQVILKSLDSIWGEDYSPYQFSAAKFLSFCQERSFSHIGITVLCNIDLYDIADHSLTINDVITRFRKQSTASGRLIADIEGTKKLEENEKEELLKVGKDHPNKKNAKDLLSTTLWDLIASLDPENKLLAREIHLAKTIIGERIKSEITTELAKISMDEFLSVNEKSAHYDDIRSKLFNYLLNNPAKEDTFCLAGMILIAVEKDSEISAAMPA